MNDDLIAALNAERYGTGQWFSRRTPADQHALDDSDLATARRRRALIADADQHLYAKEA